MALIYKHDIRLLAKKEILQSNNGLSVIVYPNKEITNSIEDLFKGNEAKCHIGSLFLSNIFITSILLMF